MKTLQKTNEKVEMPFTDTYGPKYTLDFSERRIRPTKRSRYRKTSRSRYRLTQIMKSGFSKRSKGSKDNIRKKRLSRKSVKKR